MSDLKKIHISQTLYNTCYIENYDRLAFSHTSYFTFCRYSREVGSTQVHLNLIPTTSSSSSSSDCSESNNNHHRFKTGADGKGINRYHPDPTCSKNSPGKRRNPPSTLTINHTSVSLANSPVVTQRELSQGILLNHKYFLCSVKWIIESITELQATHVEVSNGLVERALASSSSKAKMPHLRPSGNGTNSIGSHATSPSRSQGSSNMNTSGGNSTIVNKPARGWLHPDHLFAKEGVNYNVRVSIQINLN